MDLWDLPTEIIYYIFTNYLNGKDIYTLRGVSHRWKQIVDGLGEREWQKLCRKEFSKIYKDAYSKSRLSWHSLYKSLSLWQRLPYATVTSHEMPIYAYNVSLLENGIIALPQNLNDPAKDLSIYYNYPGYDCETDGIVYYDSETLEECGRVNLGFYFFIYDENEELIAVVEKEREQSKLIIILKANNEQYFVGNVPYFTWPYYYKGFEILDKVVCFQNSENEIIICKVETHGIKTVSKSEPFVETIVSLTFVTVNHVNILTAQGQIFTLIGENLSLDYCFNKSDQNNELTLEKYNFDWTQASIYIWLAGFHRDQFHEDLLRFEFKLSPKRIYRYLQIYGELVIVGLKSKIEFYYNPFGRRLVNEIKPILTFNLKSKDEFNERSKVKVVEVENGHKVIVFLSTKLFIINCIHNSKCLRF